MGDIKELINRLLDEKKQLLGFLEEVDESLKTWIAKAIEDGLTIDDIIDDEEEKQELWTPAAKD